MIDTPPSFRVAAEEVVVLTGEPVLGLESGVRPGAVEILLETPDIATLQKGFRMVGRNGDCPRDVFFGVGIMLLGAAIGIRATRKLRDAGGGLPWGAFDNGAKTKALVTNGIYAYTRNPIVLGYMLLPLGMGLLFRSLGMTILIPTLVLVIMVIRIKKWEEPDLERRFGEKYLEYKHKTPFLFPRVRPALVSFFTRKRTKQEREKKSTIS